MEKTALITGVSGQDGAYLSKLLLKKGYRVIGGERRSASGTLWRLKELDIEDDIEIADFELSEFTNIYRVIDKYNPDEIYNLAAQSFVAASFEMPIMTADVTGVGVSRMLEAIRQINPDIELVCLISSINNQFISSSRVKEISMLEGDVSTLVTNNVLEAINKKLKNIKNN